MRPAKTILRGVMLVLSCIGAVLLSQPNNAVAQDSSAAVTAAERSSTLVSAVCPVDFFFEPGCGECRRIRNQVLPELQARLGDRVVINIWDITTEAGYSRRLNFRDKLEFDSSASSLAVIDNRVALTGWTQIKQRLIPAVEARLIERLTENLHDAQDKTDETPVNTVTTPPATHAVQQLRRFSLIGVAVAGLIDGINPCAIGTLVFLVSLLLALRIRGKRLLLTGGAFCIATFVTYFALGFGLLGILDSLANIHMIQTVIETGMVILLAALCIASFADAWRYNKTRRTDAVFIKMPERTRRLAHRVIHRQFRQRRLLLGGFIAGTVVTAIESVCTGQLYVPTLVYLVKIRRQTGAALGYLIVYNLMFLVPLLLAFALAYGGLNTSKLVQFSQNNVVLAKILLGILFFALAAAIILY